MSKGLLEWGLLVQVVERMPSPEERVECWKLAV